MNVSMSTPAIVASYLDSLSLEEHDALMRLAIALKHAVSSAQDLPTSLDGRARALIVTKLQEADHWCLELIRIAAK